MKIKIIAKDKERVLKALKSINDNINYPYQFKNNTLIDIKDNLKFEVEILSSFNPNINISDANLIIFFVDCNLNKANLYKIIQLLQKSDSNKYIVIPEKDYDKLQDIIEEIEAKIETDKCEGDDYSLKTYETDIINAIESIKDKKKLSYNIIAAVIVVVAVVIVAFLIFKNKTSLTHKESEKNLTNLPIEKNLTQNTPPPQKEQNKSENIQYQSQAETIKKAIDMAIANNDIITLQDLHTLVESNITLKEYYCNKIKNLTQIPDEIKKYCNLISKKEQKKEEKITLLSEFKQAYESLPFMEFIEFVKEKLSKRCNELSQKEKAQIKNMLTQKQIEYAKNLTFDVPDSKEVLQKDIKIYRDAFFGAIKIKNCFKWAKNKINPPFKKDTFKYVKLFNSFMTLTFKRVGISIPNQTFKSLPEDIKITFFIKDKRGYKLELAYTKQNGQIIINKPKHCKGLLEDEIDRKNILAIKPSFFRFQNKIQISILLEKNSSEKPSKSYIKNLALKKEYEKAIVNYFKDPLNAKNFENKKHINFYIPLTKDYSLLLSPF